MKKLFTLVCTLLLGTSLALAQATAGSSDQMAGSTPTKKEHHKGKKAKGEKGKKAGKTKKASKESTTTSNPK